MNHHPHHHAPQYLDANNIIFMQLPNTPLTHRVLPIFEQLFLHLVKFAPNEPNLSAIDDCLKAFKLLDSEILDIINSWECPLYGHTLTCYVKLLYASKEVCSTLPPVKKFRKKEHEVAEKPPTQNSAEKIIQIDSSEHTDELIVPRDQILSIFTKYNCPCPHENCDFKTVLHSFLSTIQFSPLVSHQLSPNAFDLISPSYLNHFDTVDDISPLMLAINNPFTSRIVSYLLHTQKIDLRTPSKNSKYPLQHAIQRGSSPETLRVVKLLVENKAELTYNKVNQSLQPLALAINTRSDQIGEYLIQSGHPPNFPYSFNTTLLYASISQHMTLTSLALLEAKADVSEKPGTDGHTILHHAALFNNTDVVEKLIKMKIPADVKNSLGQTPLECLMGQNSSHGQVIKELILNGANPNRAATQGAKLPVPFICQALFRHNYDQVRALLAGAYEKSLVTGDKSQSTVVREPVKKNQVVEKQIETEKKGWFRSLFSGSKMTENTKKNEQNSTNSPTPISLFPNVNIICPRPIYQGSPFLYAIHNAPQDIVEIMIKYFKADLLTKNDNKCTILHIAISRQTNIIHQEQIHFEKQNQFIQERLGPSAYELTHHSFHSGHQLQPPGLLHTNSNSVSKINSISISTSTISDKQDEGDQTLTKNNVRNRQNTSHYGSFHSTTRLPGTFSPNGVPHLPSKSFHSSSQSNLISPSLTRNPSASSQIFDPIAIEANRTAMAKSFHLSSTIFDPFANLSSFKLSHQSLYTIPSFDQDNNQYVLSPVCYSQGLKTPDLLSTPRTPKNQSYLSSLLHQTSYSHGVNDVLRNSSSRNSSTEFVTIDTANDDTKIEPIENKQEKIVPIDTPTNPKHGRVHFSPSAMPEERLSNFIRSSLGSSNSDTPLTPFDEDIYPSMSPTLSTHSNPPPNSHRFYNPRLDPSGLTPIATTLSPITDVDSVDEERQYLIRTNLYDHDNDSYNGSENGSPKGIVLRKQINPEIESIVDWDNFDNEDEEVILLARLLKTVYNHFHNKNDHHDFELI
jgi:ankyrin repeat protein